MGTGPPFTYPLPPGIGVMKEVEFSKEGFQPVFLLSQILSNALELFFPQLIFILSNKKDQLSILNKTI